MRWAISKNRPLVYFLIFVLVSTLISAGVTRNNTIYAAGLTYVTQTTQSATPKTANIVYGNIASGDTNKLPDKDQSYMVMNSMSNGTGQEASFWSEITLNSSGTNIMMLEINATTKTSVADCSQKIYLFNYSTSTYEEVAETIIGTEDTNCVYLNESNSTITRYISSSNQIKIKLVISKSVSFTSSIDYLNIIYQYRPDTTSRAVASYDIDNASLEYGTALANNATYLKNRDTSSFSVASSTNKVAWSSREILEQDRNTIKALGINYSGNYSRSYNNSYMLSTYQIIPKHGIRT